MATYTNKTKNSSTWTNRTKNIPSTVTFFLLLQTGDYLLRQTFDRILLESANPSGSGWSNQIKH